MKKALSLILIMTIVLSAAIAGDISFVFDSFETPFAVSAGPQFSFGATDVQFILGGGLVNRTPMTDEDLSLVYGKTAVKIIDNLTDNLQIFTGAEVRYEHFTEGNEDLFSDGLSTMLFAGLRFENVRDTKLTRDGLKVTLTGRAAPMMLQGGDRYFYDVEADAVLSRTLVSIENPEGKKLFTTVLVDRVNATYISGFNIPSFETLRCSAGSKVRGIASGLYCADLQFVNNFELRLATPQIIEGIFARFILFADNALVSGTSQVPTDSMVFDKSVIQTAGAQIAVSLLDILNVGYQGSYVIRDDAYNTKGFVGELMFTLAY